MIAHAPCSLSIYLTATNFIFKRIKYTRPQKRGEKRNLEQDKKINPRKEDLYNILSPPKA